MGFEPMYLRDTGAMLYWLSNETSLEALFLGFTKILFHFYFSRCCCCCCCCCCCYCRRRRRRHCRSFCCYFYCCCCCCCFLLFSLCVWLLLLLLLLFTVVIFSKNTNLGARLLLNLCTTCGNIKFTSFRTWLILWVPRVKYSTRLKTR